MKVRACIGFSGTISMCKGQVRRMEEGEVLTDLLLAGYVEEIEEKQEEKTEGVKPPKKAEKKAVGANEGK